MSPARVAAGKKRRNGSWWRSVKLTQRFMVPGTAEATRLARRGHCAGAALRPGLVGSLMGGTGMRSFGRDTFDLLHGLTDVLVQADARELEVKLAALFPNASIKVIPSSQSVSAASTRVCSPAMTC